MTQTPPPPKSAIPINCAKPSVWVEILALRGLQPINWRFSAAYSLALLSVGFFVSSAPAHATEPTPTGLDFSLPAPLPSSASVTSAAGSTPSRNTTRNVTNAPAISPLKMPSQAIAPPLGKVSARQVLPPPPVSAPNDHRATDPSMAQPEALAPPSPPNLPDPGDQAVNINPSTPSLAAIASAPGSSVVSVASVATAAPVPPVDSASGAPASNVALNFELNVDLRRSLPQTPPLSPLAAANSSPSLPLKPLTEEPLTEALSADVQAMFEGGENSLVAIAVGSAEGTRTPDGRKTSAYHGHLDPGNGVWNLGSFSYQHGANSPADADQQQLSRLKTQAQQLYRAAQTREFVLSPQEILNGLDLANQSPAAALSRGGYIDRLLEAHNMGLEGDEAIAWARTRSFLDPDSQQWNAPGLGNTVERISSDQERRMRAIAQTVAQKAINSNWSQVSQGQTPHIADREPIQSNQAPMSETQVNQLLWLDL